MSKIADKDSGCTHALYMKLCSFKMRFVEEIVSFKPAQKKMRTQKFSFHSMKAQKEHHLDIKFVSTLGLGLFHHHFSFVVKFSFMPVSTVEEVRLSSCWTCCNLRSSQCVVSSTLSRPCLTLASFRMCHDGLFQIFQCVPTRVYVAVFILSTIP